MAESLSIVTTSGPGKTIPKPKPPTIPSNHHHNNNNVGPKRGRTPATPNSAQKKRPYRRTKRPKNYCDKSTVTTTTSAAQTPVNVYDAVLGECEDLLKASLEAQRLGRLKMASAYQLLLHTRLVGLGKRFDRTTVAANPLRTRRREGDDEDSDDEDEEEEPTNSATTTAAGGAHTTSVVEQNPPASAMAANVAAPPKWNGTPKAEETDTEKNNSPTVTENLPPALQQLTSILPSNLEMDSTMMEHLARAAVELHHQRTGRKKSADGLLASPMTGLIGSPATTPKDTSTTADTKAATSTTGSSNTHGSNKVAWSAAETEIVLKAQTDQLQTYAIAKLLPSKTEAQVKAFLKNQEKTKSAQTVADEIPSPNSKKRGGRGRKPPTTAMNTVPNANLDAKSLLQGARIGLN